MSKSNLISTHESAPSPSLPDLADLAALAAKLRDTAQALLEFDSWQKGQGGQFSQFKQAGGTSQTGSATAPEPENPPAPRKLPPEYRTYRIPGHQAEEERRLLVQYRARNWQEVFCSACCQLDSMVMLLKNFQSDVDMEGYEVQLLGETLKAPLRTLDTLSSLVADFELMPEKTRAS